MIKFIKNKYSLKSRLIIWIILGNLIIWLGISIFIWVDTSAELEEWLTHLSTTPEMQVTLKHEREDILNLLLWNLIWPFVIGIPFLIFTISFIVHIVNQDLLNLGKDIENRDGLSTKLLSSNNLPTEVVPLVNKLNELFLRVKADVEKQHRFTSDAAHELRTPMAVIRAQAQVATMAVDDLTKQHALKELMIGCDRSSHLVDQLLALARLEKIDNLNHFYTIIDLESVLTGLVATLSSLARERSQTILLTCEKQLSAPVIKSEEVLIAAMLRNLIDNALRYAPVAAAIHISLHHGLDRSVVTIEDSGPGMNAAEIERLGERFFRAGNRDFSLGSGLGWSIITQIAAVLGLKITTDRSPNLGGLRVQIRI